MDEYIYIIVILGLVGTGVYYLIKYINKPTTMPISERRGEAVKNWFKKTF